jgi:UDP-N-acetylmuramate--alanine ligase
MDIGSLKSVYFLGIGGIGMSALARYFHLRGMSVAGYDKTRTPITDQLRAEGMDVHFEEDPKALPRKIDLVIMTPAIPPDHKELQYITEKEIPVMKRSEMLGMICRNYKTIAVAGTHGKTTTSTLIAHILRTAGIPNMAFLGGISKNYGTNFIYSPEVFSPVSSNGDTSEIYCITEADEFDRSFLQLSPDIAVITSADADHLDIYGDLSHLKQSFTDFTNRIRHCGRLLLKKNLDMEPKTRTTVKLFSYSLGIKSDFFARNLRIGGGLFHFDLVRPGDELQGLVLGLPGSFNVENAVAASAVAFLCNIGDGELREALKTFEGVRRRFDFQIRREDMVYIDDYAHHPEELRACISAVRELYPGKQITGVFQPHLYSRTRDFADEFSKVLSTLDTLLLLDIYPARERPIYGVHSRMIFDKVSLARKFMSTKPTLVNDLQQIKPEILLTLGAGDIDQMVKSIVQAFSTA